MSTLQISMKTQTMTLPCGRTYVLPHGADITEKGSGKLYVNDILAYERDVGEIGDDDAELRQADILASVPENSSSVFVSVGVGMVVAGNFSLRKVDTGSFSLAMKF